MSHLERSPLGENSTIVEANITATNQLLACLRDEALHPRTLIPQDVPFADDGTFDTSVGPVLSEIRDPDNFQNSYMAGLRGDGAGQVTMLERDGGVVGRVTLTLRQDTPTTLLGERRVKGADGMSSRRENIDGQLAPAELLVQLTTQLPLAFEAKRSAMYPASRVERLRRLAHTVFGIDSKASAADMPRAIENK